MSGTDLDFRITIPATHPALPGHFPGRPIVPGMLLVAHVAAQLAASGEPACARVTAIRQVKFLSPLAPDEPCDVACRRRGGSSVEFTGTGSGGRIVVRGTFECAPA